MNFFLPQPHSKQQRAFCVFYAAYAPRLWGLILTAKLPVSDSETILTNTFVKAWNHPDRPAPVDKRSLSWLIKLAYAEGLPFTTLKPAFNGY